RTFLSDELVHRTTTSGLLDLRALAASPDTLRPRRPERPATSPRSRLILAGSTSTPPTTLNPDRAEICLRMAAPIGPRPKCITRMLDIRRIIAPSPSRPFFQWRSPPGPPALPAPPAPPARTIPAMAKAEKIAFWMRSRLASAGARGFLVGISGGIDSAVVARLAQM